MRPASILALACAPLLGGCQRPLDGRECGKLLDHYVALLTREEMPGAAPALVASKQIEARRLAAKDPRFEFSRCPDEVTRSGFDCALAAPTVDAVEQCLLF